jgi:4-amino-4-deoxy-L-arabinose transferase-like glycosyltransferase
MKILQKLQSWHIASFLFVVSAVLLLVRISVQPLFDWDEAIYAQVARELGTFQNALTLTHGGTLWFHKPPLQFWLTNAAFSLTSNLELAVRIVSVLSGAGLVALSFLFGNHLRGRKTGALAALVTLTTLHLVEISRDGMLDAFLSFWIVLALYAAMLARKDVRFWIVAGIAAGGAIMTKGAAGVIAPLAILVFALVIPERLTVLKSRWFWGGVVSMLAVALPWHILMYLQHGDRFVDEYIRYHVVARTQEGIEGHAGTWMDYVDTIYRRAFPWSLLYPVATLYLLVRTYVQKKDFGLSAIWVPSLCIAVLYGFVVQSKLSQYIIPLYPFTAIACAILLADLLRAKESRAWKWGVLAVCAALVLVGAYETRKAYRSHGLEYAGSVKEHRGLRLMSETIDSDYPLVVIAGVKWWPSAAFYSNTRSPSRPTAEELRNLTEQSPEGVDVLLGKGEAFTQPEGTRIQEFGESEDFRYFRLIRE